MQNLMREVDVHGVPDETWQRFTDLADAEGLTYAAMFTRLLAHYGIKAVSAPPPNGHARPGRRQVALGGVRHRKVRALPVTVWRRFKAQAIIEGTKPAVLFTRMVARYQISHHP